MRRLLVFFNCKMCIKKKTGKFFSNIRESLIGQ